MPGNSFLAGVRANTPFTVADAFDGLAFGTLAVALGTHPLAAVVMSGTAFPAALSTRR